ncbi:retrovirus-related pol polyprotein from transposon TNT 1-94 [Tanacetum coccineum]
MKNVHPELPVPDMPPFLPLRRSTRDHHPSTRYSAHEHMCRLSEKLDTGFEQAPDSVYKKLSRSKGSPKANRKTSSDHCVFLSKDCGDDYLSSYLEPAKPIIDIRILCDRGAKKLHISQEQYIENVLCKFNMDKAKVVSSPLTTNFKLTDKDCPSSKKNIEKMDRVPYASAVGSLMYVMVCTRSDLAHGSEDSNASQKNKTYDIRYHWIRDAIEDDMFELNKVHTDDNASDMLTKAVAREKLKTEEHTSRPRYKARLVVKGFSQKRGIDFDEIFSPVVKMGSIRVVLGLAASLDLEVEQMDVKTAFLHGDLDKEIYMEQPEGFQVKGKERLREVDMRFNMLSKVVSSPLTTNFKLTDKDCPSSKKNIEKMDRVPYASAVGSLMYAMVCTRPDLAHAVGVVSRFLSNPGKKHWEAVKWIFRYLRGTSKLGITFGNGKPMLVGFTDSDMAGNKDNMKSTSGYLE